MVCCESLFFEVEDTLPRCSRTSTPWNGRTVACGMEFGVSPFPETNQQMIERGSLFGVPVFRTLGPRAQMSVEYSAFFRPTSGNAPLARKLC